MRVERAEWWGHLGHAESLWVVYIFCLATCSHIMLSDRSESYNSMVLKSVWSIDAGAFSGFSLQYSNHSTVLHPTVSIHVQCDLGRVLVASIGIAVICVISYF